MYKYFFSFLFFSFLAFGADTRLEYERRVQQKPYISEDPQISGIFRVTDPPPDLTDVIDVVIGNLAYSLSSTKDCRFIVNTKTINNKYRMKLSEAYPWYDGKPYRPKLSEKCSNFSIERHERERVRFYQNYYTEVIEKKGYKTLGFESLEDVTENITSEYLSSLLRRYVSYEGMSSVERLILRKELKMGNEKLFFMDMTSTQADAKLIEMEPGYFLLRKSSQPDNQSDEITYLSLSRVIKENDESKIVRHRRIVHISSFGYALQQDGDLEFFPSLLDLLESLRRSGDFTNFLYPQA